MPPSLYFWTPCSAPFSPHVLLFALLEAVTYHRPFPHPETPMSLKVPTLVLPGHSFPMLRIPELLLIFGQKSLPKEKWDWEVVTVTAV